MSEFNPPIDDKQTARMAEAIDEEMCSFTASEVMGLIVAYVTLEEDGLKVPNPAVLVMAADYAKSESDKPLNLMDLAEQTYSRYTHAEASLKEMGFWDQLRGMY